MSTTQRPLSRETLTTHGTGHPRLHLVHGGHLYGGASELADFPLRQVRTVIGSGEHADVGAPQLQPQHAEISRTAHDEYEIAALTGQVSVNGAVCARSSLHTGDLIRCGPWAASFGRDASTDHVPIRSQRYGRGPRGLLERWNRLVFLVYGTSTQAPPHRNAPRQPGAAGHRHGSVSATTTPPAEAANRKEAR